jgi:hypothetical protein
MRRLLALTLIAILVPLAIVITLNVTGDSGDANAGMSGRRFYCC